MAPRKTREQATVADAHQEIFDISEKIHGYLEDIDVGLVSTLILSVTIIFLISLFIGITVFGIKINMNANGLLIGFFAFVVFVFAILGFHSVYKSYSHFQSFKYKLDTIVRFRKFDISPPLPDEKNPIDRMKKYLSEDDERFGDALATTEEKPRKVKKMNPETLKGGSGEEYRYDFILLNEENPPDYFIIKNFKEPISTKDLDSIRNEINDITKKRKMLPSRVVLVQQGDDIDEKVILDIQSNWIKYKKTELPIEVISETSDKKYLFGILYFW